MASWRLVDLSPRSSQTSRKNRSSTSEPESHEASRPESVGEWIKVQKQRKSKKKPRSYALVTSENTDTDDGNSSRPEGSSRVVNLVGDIGGGPSRHRSLEINTKKTEAVPSNFPDLIPCRKVTTSTSIARENMLQPPKPLPLMDLDATTSNLRVPVEREKVSSKLAKLRPLMDSFDYAGGDPKITREKVSKPSKILPLMDSIFDAATSNHCPAREQVSALPKLLPLMDSLSDVETGKGVFRITREKESKPPKLPHLTNSFHKATAGDFNMREMIAKPKLLPLLDSIDNAGGDLSVLSEKKFKPPKIVPLMDSFDDEATCDPALKHGNENVCQHPKLLPLIQSCDETSESGDLSANVDVGEYLCSSFTNAMAFTKHMENVGAKFFAPDPEWFMKENQERREPGQTIPYSTNLEKSTENKVDGGFMVWSASKYGREQKYFKEKRYFHPTVDFEGFLPYPNSNSDHLIQTPSPSGKDSDRKSKYMIFPRKYRILVAGNYVLVECAIPQNKKLELQELVNQGYTTWVRLTDKFSVAIVQLFDIQMGQYLQKFYGRKYYDQIHIDCQRIYVLVSVDLHWNSLAALQAACDLRRRGYQVCLYMTRDTYKELMKFPVLNDFLQLNGYCETEWTNIQYHRFDFAILAVDYDAPVISLYAYRSILAFCSGIILVEPPSIEGTYKSVVQAITPQGRPGINIAMLNIVKPTPYLEDTPAYLADILDTQDEGFNGILYPIFPM